MSTRIAEGRRIVQSYTGWAAGSGLIPLPLIDVAGIMTTQIAMIRSLSRLYAVPFERDRARAVAMSAMGGLLPQGFAVTGVPTFLKFVPVVGTLLGFAVMPAAAVATTLVLGEAFIRHFESGGILRDADPLTVAAACRTGAAPAADTPPANADSERPTATVPLATPVPDMAASAQTVSDRDVRGPPTGMPATAPGEEPGDAAPQARPDIANAPPHDAQHGAPHGAMDAHLADMTGAPADTAPTDADPMAAAQPDPFTPETGGAARPVANPRRPGRSRLRSPPADAG